MDTTGILKAIIAPHAGFTYSGPTAAWAYKNVEPSLYDRVVLLGPSHSLPFQQLGLTSCQEWATPLGNLPVLTSWCQKLYETKTDAFLVLPKKAEENEHSLEMHLPFIQKIFKDAGKEVELLPIMVGQV